MENDEFEAHASAGRQSPATSPPAGTISDSSAVANDGEVVRVFNNVPTEKLSVIDQLPTGGSVPDGGETKFEVGGGAADGGAGAGGDGQRSGAPHFTVPGSLQP
jgi:hypothetical protein